MNQLRKYILLRSSFIIPCWAILIKDIIIVLFSLASAYTLRNNFQLTNEELHGMYSQMAPVGILSFIIFRIMGIHKGIIRHTGLNDVIRILKAILFLGGLMVLINASVLSNIIPKVYYIPFSVIIIFSLLSSMIIIMIRSSIRVFYYWLKESGDTYNVLIFGAGNAGLITKNVLHADQSRKIRVTGFVDNNPGKIGKSIEGIQVFSTGVFNPKFLKQNSIKEIIFAINNISIDRKRDLLQELLTIPGVSVKEIPPVDSWINGELSTKQIKRIEITDLLYRNEIKLSDSNVREYINGKRVMVTGAAGSIGSELVRQLCTFSPDLLVMVDQAETPMFDLENEIVSTLVNKGFGTEVFSLSDMHFIIANIADQCMMNKVFEEYKPQIIFHAAAYKHVPMMEKNPFEAVRVNILGSKNIADLATKYNADKFVMISTDKAVNPTNVMGASKRAAEIYIQSLNNHLSNSNTEHTRFITTRFGNVLGSNGSVIPLFEKQIAKGGPVTVTHPEVTRYFMTIPEACRLVLEAGVMGAGGEIMMFDMGNPIKIVDLAHNMIKLSGFEPDKDIKIVFTGLRPGEKLFEELLYSKELGIKTYHPKISIAKVRALSYSEISVHFDYFTKVVNNSLNSKNGVNNPDDNMALVARIKELIPEYKSDNSIYQKLDRNIGMSA